MNNLAHQKNEVCLFDSERGIYSVDGLDIPCINVNENFAQRFNSYIFHKLDSCCCDVCAGKRNIAVAKAFVNGEFVGTVTELSVEFNDT